MSRGKRYEEPKLNLKKVFGVLLGIVVFIMVIISIAKLVKNHREVNKLNTTSYYTVLENGKWGVIDNKGNVIIQPTYDEMVVIPNNQKAIFICAYDVSEGAYKSKAINEKNEQLFSQYELVEPIDNYDARSNTWYEDNVLRVRKDGKFGLINYKGELVLDTVYDDITSLKGVKNSLIIKKGSTVGICNNYGNIIADAIYKEIKPLGDSAENGYIIITTDNKYGVVGIDKNIKLEPVYEEIKYIGSQEFYSVKVEGKSYLFDSANKTTSQASYESIESINGDSLIIKTNNLYGIVDKAGAAKVACEYEYLEYAFSNYYIAKKAGKYGVITDAGEEKVAFKYKDMISNKSGEFIKADIDEIESVILNKNLEEKVTGIVSEINNTKGYIKVRVSQDNKYYNFKLEEKQNKEIFTSNTLFLVKENGKYGYVDREGKKVVECVYDDAMEQNSCGYCAVQKDGKWGSLNPNGTVAQDTTIDLTNNLYIDFIGNWHLNITGDYYTR